MLNSRDKNKNSPGYDNIDGSYETVTEKEILTMPFIFNIILRLDYFLVQWKCAQIIIFYKQQNLKNCVNAYRPISWHSLIWKVYERTLLSHPKLISHAGKLFLIISFDFEDGKTLLNNAINFLHNILGPVKRKEYCSASMLVNLRKVSWV